MHPVPVITTTLVVPSPTSLSWALLMSTKILAAGWTSADATYGSLIYGLQRFLATSGYNINRDMSDMIITNCKIMQASNLVVLEQKAKLYDSMMSQCVSVYNQPL